MLGLLLLPLTTTVPVIVPLTTGALMAVLGLRIGSIVGETVASVRGGKGISVPPVI